MKTYSKQQHAFDFEEVLRIATAAVTSYNVSVRHTLSSYDLDDICSMTAMKVYENIGKFNPEIASFRTWTSKIAVNTAKSFLRQYHRNDLLQIRLDQQYDGQDEYDYLGSHGICDNSHAESRLISKESSDDIMNAVNSLGYENSRCLNLVIDGYKNKEIAAACGIEAGTFGVRLHRTRKELARNSRVSAVMHEFGMAV